MLTKRVFKQGSEYNVEFIGDEILVENESGELGLVGISAIEAVRLRAQPKENGYWDDWFNKHFKILQLD